jgi:hypothetical protein
VRGITAQTYLSPYPSHPIHTTFSSHLPPLNPFPLPISSPHPPLVLIFASFSFSLSPASSSHSFSLSHSSVSFLNVFQRLPPEALAHLLRRFPADVLRFSQAVTARLQRVLMMMITLFLLDFFLPSVLFLLSFLSPFHSLPLFLVHPHFMFSFVRSLYVHHHHFLFCLRLPFAPSSTHWDLDLNSTSKTATAATQRLFFSHRR